MFQSWPENEPHATRRAKKLTKMMNKRVHREAQNSTRAICYLMISHGTLIDEAAFYTYNKNYSDLFDGTSYLNMAFDKKN
jgi:hypothetical protein